MSKFLLAGLALVGMAAGNVFAGGGCCEEIGSHCCRSCDWGFFLHAELGCDCASGPRCKCPPAPRPQWYLEYPCPGEWYNQGVNPWTYFGADASAYGCAQGDVSNRPYYWYAK